MIIWYHKTHSICSSGNENIQQPGIMQYIRWNACIWSLWVLFVFTWCFRPSYNDFNESSFTDFLSILGLCYQTCYLRPTTSHDLKYATFPHKLSYLRSFSSTFGVINSVDQYKIPWDASAIGLFGVSFSHVHYNVIQRRCVNCLTYMLDYTVM